jgi:hypothetical protein
MSVLPLLHDLLDVLREELRLESVDDVEEELSVDMLHSAFLLNDIWQIHLQLWVTRGISCQCISTQFRNLRNVHYLNFTVV